MKKTLVFLFCALTGTGQLQHGCKNVHCAGKFIPHALRKLEGRTRRSLLLQHKRECRKSLL